MLKGTNGWIEVGWPHPTVEKTAANADPKEIGITAADIDKTEADIDRTEADIDRTEADARTAGDEDGTCPWESESVVVADQNLVMMESLAADVGPNVLEEAFVWYSSIDQIHEDRTTKLHVELIPVELILDALIHDALILDALILDALILDALILDALILDALILDAWILDALILDALISDALVLDALILDALIPGELIRRKTASSMRHWLYECHIASRDWHHESRGWSLEAAAEFQAMNYIGLKVGESCSAPRLFQNGTWCST